MKIPRLSPVPAVLLALLAAAAPSPSSAQTPPASLGVFIDQVAGLWNETDVSGFLTLVRDDGRFLLDTGSGTETVNVRHAAAALRALFAERETVAAHVIRATVAGERPLSGFGEISWTFRGRGAPGEQARVIYVAVVHDAEAWRVTELRILP